MNRFLSFIKLLLGLTAVLFAAWLASAQLLPQGAFRPFFSDRFAGLGGLGIGVALGRGARRR